MKKLSLFLLSLTLLMSVSAFGQQNIKYVFYFIGDGMGVNQVNGTEMYLAEKEGRIGTESLCFTQFPVATLVTTYSTKNSVTDSSAAGTALACGQKTVNGTIGMNGEHTSPIYSVAQWAKDSGKNVGVATSVSIDHATPAAFYAHQPDRNMYYEIACDLPLSGFDFFAGAGFLSPEKAFKGESAESVFDVLKSKGYNVVYGLKGFKGMKNKENVVLVEKDGRGESLNLAIDREEGDLTLPQITECAIETLTQNDKGFFLMIEGGMIDWACHANDAASVFTEVQDMDNAVKIAYEFYKQHPDETLIVVTADHETGGISLGNGPYELKLSLLENQKGSITKLSKLITDLRNQNKKVEWSDFQNLLKENMGFWDKFEPSKEETAELKEAFEDAFEEHESHTSKTMYAEVEELSAIAIKIMANNAHIEWGSHGHSAGYVPLFAIGKGSETFVGKIDNTQIAHKIAELAGYKKR